MRKLWKQKGSPETMKVKWWFLREKYQRTICGGQGWFSLLPSLKYPAKLLQDFQKLWILHVRKSTLINTFFFLFSILFLFSSLHFSFSSFQDLFTNKTKCFTIHKTLVFSVQILRICYFIMHQVYLKIVEYTLSGHWNHTGDKYQKK